MGQNLVVYTNAPDSDELCFLFLANLFLLLTFLNILCFKTICTQHNFNLIGLLSIVSLTPTAAYRAYIRKMWLISQSAYLVRQKI